MSEAKKSISHVRRYLVTGILTIIPLWITWLVVEFLFAQLAKFGMPWLWTFSKAIRTDSSFAQSNGPMLNFKLPIQIRLQSQPVQDVLLYG